MLGDSRSSGSVKLRATIAIAFVSRAKEVLAFSQINYLIEQIYEMVIWKEMVKFKPVVHAR